MNASISQPTKSNDEMRTALLISILCHVLLFSMTALTFNPSRIPLKPVFVFLGGILKTRDLLPPAPSQAAETKGVALPVLKHPPLTASAQEEVKVQKPIFSNGLRQSQKAHFKPKTAKKSIKKPKSGDTQDILGIDPQVPPRVPLELYNP